MRVRVMIAVGVSLGALTLAGCQPLSAATDSGTDAPAPAGRTAGTPVPAKPAGGSEKPSTKAMSNAEICAKALGTVTLSQIGDNEHRKAAEAQDKANVLHTLAGQTQDHSLQQALNAAAAQAGEEVGKSWTLEHLRQWADREKGYIAAIRKAC